MSMVHDNTIKSYSVDFEAETMVIKTVYHDSANEIFEDTDIVFTGYLAHEFLNVSTVNIIYDIKEIYIDEFLKYNPKQLESGKGYLWSDWCVTKKDIIQYVEAKKYRIFNMFPVCGLSGWVFAKQMDIIVNGELFTPEKDTY